MSFEELDNIFSPEDRLIDTPSGTYMAKTVGIRIKSWMNGEGRKFNPGVRMLGLGAGGAEPELAVTKYFGIPDDCVTLVERQSLPDILTELKKGHPQINYHYGEGLFQFLQNTKEKYDLVTAFYSNIY